MPAPGSRESPILAKRPCSQVMEGGGSWRSEEEQRTGGQDDEADSGACVPRYEMKKASVLARSGKTT